MEVYHEFIFVSVELLSVQTEFFLSEKQNLTYKSDWKIANKRITFT